MLQIPILKYEFERVSRPCTVPLQPLESSSGLERESKERKRAKRKEEDLLSTRLEELIKPERREVLVLKEKQVHKDKGTRLEATRRLGLLEDMPRQLLALKRVDRERLVEVELPMIDLQKKDLRRSILRERRVESDSGFF
jgi:hypothetical protein